MKYSTITVGPEKMTVHYLRKGRGAPLLYLHHLLGLAASEQAIEELAASYDVIAPYAPGFGPAKNELAAIDPGPLDLVLHNCDVLDAFGIESAHVLGISIGAWMAAELAAVAPQRVRSLVLVNPLGLWLDGVGGEDPFAQHPGKPSQCLFADPDGRQKALIANRDKLDAHVEELLNLRASAKFLWPIPDTGVIKRLPRVKAPTLILTSDQDTVVPEPYGPAWRKAIPHAELKTIHGAGHVADIEQPAQLAALAATFIGGDGVAAVA